MLGGLELLMSDVLHCKTSLFTPKVYTTLLPLVRQTERNATTLDAAGLGKDL